MHDRMSATIVIRQLIILVVGVALLGGMRRASAQSPGTSKPQTALADAKQLGTQAEQLRKQGKFAEALPLAEQSLSMCEKELGPIHPEVATSLHRLAVLQGALPAHGKALPPLAR